MGWETKREGTKNKVWNGRFFVGCVDLSLVAMETKQKALEWAIYLELLKEGAPQCFKTSKFVARRK